MKVTVVGCGEAFEERFPNNSLLVETGGFRVLCDCGYSVPPAVWRMGLVKDEIDCLYISHAHADHYFGVPALLGRMWEEGRAKPLTVVSQGPVLAMIREVMDYGYRTLAKRFEFPVEFREAAVEGVEVGPVSMRFAPTTHSVTNLLVRMEAEGGSVCYSGDGMFTKESRELVRGADLVVHEAFSFEPSPVHADIPQLIAMAQAEGVRELALTHVQRGVRWNEAARIESAIAGAGIRVGMPEPGFEWRLEDRG